MWVFGVDNRDGENIFVFRSNDLEHWKQRRALKLTGWGLFNTSVCKAGDRYVMAIEVGKNRLGDVDTMRRHIYIHGSPEPVEMGRPGSIGCIRMRNADIIELFDLVPPYTRVAISA